MLIKDCNIIILLLFSSTDDIPYADQIKTLIKDVWDVRIAKLRKSIDQMIAKQERHAQVFNLINVFTT